ncbi:hypothetical protein ACQ4PT_066852 [Festuca glaucescens]
MASETFPPPAATSAVQHTDAATTVVRTSTGHEARTEAKTCDVQHIATVGGGSTQPDHSSALDSSGNHLAMLSSQPMSGDNRDKTMEASAEQSLTRTSTIQSSSTASTLKASSIMSTPAKVDDNNSESLKAPKVGMVFKSEEDAYEFYNEYAGKIGFSIRKSHSKLRPDKTIYKKHIVCSNEGERHTHSTHETLKQNAETRSRCDARVQFSIARDGVWKVQKVVLEHNHYLASPDKRHMLRSQRRLVESDKLVIGHMRKAGFKPAEVFKIFKQWYGGPQNWAAVYRNDSFSADMTTTQRSEGMNNVFKKQFRKRLCLSELLVEYEKCAVSLRENELDANFKSRKSTPVPYEAAQATDVDKATPTVGIPTACPVTAASLRRICDRRRDERLRWAQLEAVARAVLPKLMADDVPLTAWAAFGSRLSSPAQGEVGRRG